jgi:hypothetical protein
MAKHVAINASRPRHDLRHPDGGIDLSVGRCRLYGNDRRRHIYEGLVLDIRITVYFTVPVVIGIALLLGVLAGR